MKFFLILFALLGVVTLTYGQAVGIKDNGTDPHASAILDVQATQKGVLIPRMRASDRLQIPSPATGLMVYQTNTEGGFPPGLYIHFASGWERIARADEIVVLNSWTVSGNNQYSGVSGNVGIGTSSPTSKLHVVGNILQTSGDLIINRTSAILQLQSGGVSKGFMQLSGDNVRIGTNAGNSAASLIFRMAGGDRIAIDSAGRLGIGTMTPTSRLHLEGGSMRIEDGNLLINNGSFNINNGGQFSRGGINLSGNNLHVGTYSSNPLGKLILRTNSTDRIYIDKDGKVGIGIDNPSAILHFATDVLNKKIALYDQNGNDHQFYGFGVNSATLRYQVDQTGADHVFYAATGASTSNLLMRIKGNGNVMIGNPSQIHKLNVAGGTFLSGNNELIRLDGSGNSRFIQFFRSGVAKSFISLDGDHLTIGNSTGNNAGNLRLYGNQILIGTTNTATGYKVNIGGKVICEELRVELQNSWPDYVFDKTYDLMPLHEVEHHIQQHQHLPNIPSADQLADAGLHIGEMQRLQMEKIEELFLYIIDLKKEVEILKSENEDMRMILQKK